MTAAVKVKFILTEHILFMQRKPSPLFSLCLSQNERSLQRDDDEANTLAR